MSMFQYVNDDVAHSVIVEHLLRNKPSGAITMQVNGSKSLKDLLCEAGAALIALDNQIRDHRAGKVQENEDQDRS